jgi:5-methylcytosine-specific restriction endonuclease McrA
MNNDIGYKIDNVVPCCGKCNRAKYKSSIEDFAKHVKSLYENLLNKGMMK